MNARMETTRASTIEITTTQTMILVSFLVFMVLNGGDAPRGHGTYLRKTTKRLIGWALGTTTFTATGLQRSMRGLRTGDQRELFIGLGLLAVAFLERSAPRKELLYRKTVGEGSAIVVHHRAVGGPKIEVHKL